MNPSISESGMNLTPQVESSRQNRLTFGAAALVAVFAGGLLLTNFGPTRALTHHEVMFAQPAKEMLATGNWVLPKFAGVPCTHKPPGTNWVLAVTMGITGSDAEWVVRLPSAIAGAMAALLIAAFTARWFGMLTGVVAGVMQATTFYVLQLGRLAECDVFLIAATIGALYTFAVVNVESPRGRSDARWLPWLFYACVTLSFFFKGLVGPVFTLGGCGLYLLVSREMRVLKFLANPIGVAMAVLLPAAWLGLAYSQYPAIVHDQIIHHVGRMQGELQGEKNPLFYLYSIPMILLPWTPYCLAGVVLAARSDWFPRALWRLAICWIVPGLVVLCISEFKSKHYPAPLMAPLIMIGAVSLIRFFQWRQTATWRWHAAAVLSCVVGTVAAAISVVRLQPEGHALMAGMCAALGGGILLMIYFEIRAKLRAELIVMAATTWVLCSGSLYLVARHHDSYEDATALAERANEILADRAPLYVVGLVENQITYYLDSPVVRVDQADELRNTQVGSGPWYVLAPENMRQQLSDSGSVYAVDQCDSIRRHDQPDDRITLFRIDRQLTADAGSLRIYR